MHKGTKTLTSLVPVRKYVETLNLLAMTCKEDRDLTL